MFTKLGTILFACILSIPFLSIEMNSQTIDRVEEINVVNFYTDKKITVRFEADPDFSGALGHVTVDLNPSGKATISGEFKNLKSPLDIGGQYSTYVLWAILADESTQILGPLKINGKEKLSKASFKTERQLTDFGMILTAEPHFKPRAPSQAIVLRSAPPSGNNSNLAASRKVKYTLSENDYSRTREKFDKKGEKVYRETPLILYGAKYAVDLAKDAGAATYASEKYNEALSEKDRLEDLWKQKAKQEILEQQARKTIGLAAEAEVIALANKKGKRAELEKSRTDDRFNAQEEELSDAIKAKTRLEGELERAKAERDRFYGDFEAKNEQSKRFELISKQEEEKSRILQEQNINLQVENKILKNRIRQLEIIKDWNNGKMAWKKFLTDYGSPVVKDDDIILALPSSVWTEPESDEIDVGTVDLVPLFQKLVEADYLEITIRSYIMSTDNSISPNDLADARSKTIRDQLVRYGVSPARIGSETINENPPVKRKKGAVPAISSRIEIYLKLSNEY